MMRKILSLIFISTLSLQSFADDNTKIRDTVYYINESIEICQPPTDFVHLPSVKGEPYFLNYREKNRPETYLTIVIWGRDIPRLEINPENYFSSENMCMKGIVSYHNGKKQLIIRDLNQLVVK